MHGYALDITTVNSTFSIFREGQFVFWLEMKWIPLGQAVTKTLEVLVIIDLWWKIDQCQSQALVQWNKNDFGLKVNMKWKVTLFTFIMYILYFIVNYSLVQVNLNNEKNILNWIHYIAI